MCFGDTLQMILIRKKIKVKDLAEKTGVTAAALSNILNSRRGVREQTYFKILENLELSENERFELKKAYSLDKMDSDIASYFIELERNNEKLKNLIEALKFFKK